MALPPGWSFQCEFRIVRRAEMFDARLSRPIRILCLELPFLCRAQPGRNILIDTCHGNDKNDRNGRYAHMKYDYLGNLGAQDCARGYRYGALHPSSYRSCRLEYPLSDGKWVPTFPNAKYLMTREITSGSSIFP